MIEKLLTISRTAELLGVSVSALRCWDKSGEFAAVRTPGGHRRYRLSDVKKFQGIDDDSENNKAIDGNT